MAFPNVTLSIIFPWTWFSSPVTVWSVTQSGVQINVSPKFRATYVLMFVTLNPVSMIIWQGILFTWLLTKSLSTPLLIEEIWNSFTWHFQISGNLCLTRWPYSGAFLHTFKFIFSSRRRSDSYFLYRYRTSNIDFFGICLLLICRLTSFAQSSRFFFFSLYIWIRILCRNSYNILTFSVRSLLGCLKFSSVY